MGPSPDAFIYISIKLFWWVFRQQTLYCSQTQVEVAVAAADGDFNVAVEILMAHLVCI